MFSLPLWLIAIAGAAFIGSAVEAGRVFGARAARRANVDSGTIEAATLGLLALILGFTFSISIERHDARRNAIVAEANAIGTTALRASLLAPEHARPILDGLSRYAALRREISGAVANGKVMVALIARSDAEVDRLWSLTRAATAANSAEVPTGIFIEALNEMIDEQERRIIAAEARVPGAVLAVVYLAAFVALGFSGFSAGADANRSCGPAHVLGLLVGLVILLIQDLDRPGRGLVNIDQSPIVDAEGQITRVSEALALTSLRSLTD
jgi:hypothetical protein